MSNIVPASPEWIADVVKRFPCHVTKSGLFKSCPVRLSFPSVFTPAKAMEAGQKERFTVTLLFPQGADLMPLINEETRVINDHYAADRAKGKRFAVPKSCVRDQGEKAHAGYEPGCKFIASSNLRQPDVYDAAGAKITDPSRVYPGVWAIVLMSPYFRKVATNPGVSFGLEGLQIIRDDAPFGGGSRDVAADIAPVSFGPDTDAELNRMFAGAN